MILVPMAVMLVVPAAPFNDIHSSDTNVFVLAIPFNGTI